MNIAVFAAYPYGSDEGGSEAYKPAVGVVLGGACLTAGLALGIAADAAAGALLEWGYPWLAANIPFLRDMSNYVAV